MRPREPSTSDGFSARSKRARRSDCETLTALKLKRGRRSRLNKSKVIDDESSSTSPGEEIEEEASSFSKNKEGKA
ncbi:hypothetical protein BGZ79_000208 [Entomortierella chlamydospora]|nr:hypothetical protein BGZ79_000208 [Entomortierella chlamydospora]